jgi:hypothetical protein
VLNFWLFNNSLLTVLRNVWFISDQFSLRISDVNNFLLFYVWARISSQFGCLSTSFDFLVSFGLWLICIVNLFDLIADFFSAVIILYIYVNSILISVFINIVITLCYVVQRQFGDWFTCLWSS